MLEGVLNGVSVLVVEDEVLLRKRLAAYLEHQGGDVTTAGEVGAARRLAQQLNFDYALLDVNLPDGKGTDLLREAVFSAGTGVIVMTAEGGVDGAVEAMRLGALDYLVKPFEPEELPLVFRRAGRARQAARLTEHQREHAAEDEFFFGEALAGVRQQLDKIIAADRRLGTRLPPVLVQGETGTGKTAMARWLHASGPRSAQALVEVNCSALPGSLAESELFGHERGAFTDARATRMGLFEAASGGTLFLDELPSLEPALQAKVLKAIEDRVIRRLGGNKSLPVDVRVIAAAGPDLRERVGRGEFREDLFHRLDLFRVELPPLRERGEDILRLAERFLEQLCRRHRLPRRGVTTAGRRRLLGYAWPGNVRELAHELERAIVFAEEDDLSFEHLPVGPATMETAQPATEGAGGGDWWNRGYCFPEKGFSLEAAIHRFIEHALHQTDGNVSAAARMLGVSRDYLRYRLEGKQRG